MPLLNPGDPFPRLTMNVPGGETLTVPFEYHGRAVAAQGLGQLFAQGHRYQLIETRANGQPAFGLYRKDPRAGILHASGLLVITLAGSRVSAMTMFGTGVLASFGLPRTLPA
jgi:RNA polymerase sigma-70 factor (ECF subfamily)